MSQIKETMLDDPNLVAYDAHNAYNRAQDYASKFVGEHRAWAKETYSDSGAVYASLTGALTAELTLALDKLYTLQEQYADLERRYTEAVHKQWAIHDKYAGQVDDVLRAQRHNEALQAAGLDQ